MKQSVQTLRGLACVFLVAFHAIGSRPDKGLMMDDGTVLRHLADTFLYLRLPAFAFVAGLVYSFRSVQPGQPVGGFVLGKARRLLVPLLVVGSMQFALEAAAGGLDFRRIFWLPVFPHNHFWFLEAIFAIFVLVALLDRAGVLRRRAAVAAATLLAAAVCSLEVVTTHLLSADGAVYLLPFFFLGLCFGRFGDPLAIPGGVAIAWLLVAVGAVATQAGLLGLLDHPRPAHRAGRAPVRRRRLRAPGAHRLAEPRARAYRRVLVRHLPVPHVRRGRPAGGAARGRRPLALPDVPPHAGGRPAAADPGRAGRLPPPAGPGAAAGPEAAAVLGRGTPGPGAAGVRWTVAGSDVPRSGLV